MHKRQTKLIPIYELYLDIIISDDLEKCKVIADEPRRTKEYFAVAFRNFIKSPKGVSKTTPSYVKAVTVILNPNNSYSYMTPQVLVHEAVHVKNMVFRELGYKPKTDNDEAEAYFVEWIFSEMESFLKKVTNDKSNKKAARSK